MKRTISPFPHKVKLPAPWQRIKWGDVSDERLIAYYKSICGKAFNPLVKEYKYNIIGYWCNMEFGPDGWDFEYLENTDGQIIEYWLCFLNEEIATLFALKWL